MVVGEKEIQGWLTRAIAHRTRVSPLVVKQWHGQSGFEQAHVPGTQLIGPLILGRYSRESNRVVANEDSRVFVFSKKMLSKKRMNVVVC